MGDKVPKHRSSAGPDRRTSQPASDATVILPIVRATDATQIRVYRAVAGEWPWRPIAAAGSFAIVCLGVAGVLAILGERDGLYLAMFGIGGFLSTLTFNTIDWTLQRRQEKR